MIINRRTLLSRQESIDGRLKHACTTGLAERSARLSEIERKREGGGDNRERVAVEKGEERKPIEAERGNEIETNEIASKKTFTLSRLVSSPLSVGNFSPPDEDQPLPISTAALLSRSRTLNRGLNHGKQKRNKRK